MDPVVGEDTAAAGNTLSADELESWTLLDSSPRRSPNPVQTMDTRQKDHPSRVEDEDEEEEAEEEDVSEAESASEELDEEEEEPDQEQEEKVEEVVSVKEKTSRVEVVQEKGPAARDTRQDDAVQKKKKKHRKKRTDSEPSVDSHDECSSDGISVISESDGSETLVRSRDQRKVHLAKGIRLEPVVTPVELDLKEQQQQTQLSRERSVSDDAESKQLVREDAIVPWGGVNRTSVVVLGMFVTAIVAILVGNSRLHANRIDEYSFQHEQRISELELENNILKNEMNKLKHLYTRSELDEQVQQADTEWAKVLDEKLAEEQEQAQPEPEPEPEPEPPAEEPLTFRKVPPQDEDVKHKVVWSGDDGQPMLIADKDYVLPDFCFNKDAVQDDLFSEYSGKYCDIKKRKIEAKQRKAEFARKNHKRYRGEQKDYTEYIIPTKEEVDEYQRQATATPPKPPSLSPFDFDYQKAFETIKEEGAVIVDSLVAILDLDPEPEYLPTPSPSTSSLESSSYQADDEASPSPAPSTDSVPSEIRWESYPPWVREKYESLPEMHAKLRHKESLLWDWERKKNEFLHQVGLETLEEVGRKSEDELRQRRDEYKSKGGQQRQSGEWRKEEHQYKERKHDGRKEEFRGKKYDERKGGKERYEERKEWNDRSRGRGENRSRDHEEQHHNQHHGKDHQQQLRKNDSDRKPEHHGESSKEWKNTEYRQDGSREASGAGKPYSNKKEAWKDFSREDKKHSGERDHKKDWKESGSGEYRKNHSGESRDGKPQNHRKDWKDGSGERDGKPYQRKQWKEASGEHSGEHGKRKDQSGERKDDHWKQHGDDKRGGAKRNGDQWNWSKDHSGEDPSREGSYLSQYRGEDHHKKKEQESWKHEGKRNYRDDDDDDDDDHDHHKKHHGGKEEYQRKHHHKDDDHWKRKKHHDGDRKWKEHSQERRR